MKTELRQEEIQTEASVMSNDQREQLMKGDVVSGSEILLRSLLLEGVDCVFGYPGGNALYIYDAMYDNPAFRHLLARHEQGAIHAADGYARSTGKVGVCIATSGPGATNLVTGIATAHMDSVPLVIITGNVPSTMVGTDAFQEADIVGITMPIIKHSYFVSDVRDIALTVREAFYIANTGRKGPVLIDIPKDVSATMTAFHWPKIVSLRGYHPSHQFNPSQVDALLDAITRAKRPVILAGAGVIHGNASQQLIDFVNTARIPVITTLLGLGGFPSGHPLWLGMPGMHGTYAANIAIQRADLLISMGARFDDRVTMKTSGFAPRAEVAHIDVDKAEINKTIKTAYPILGDIKDVLNYAMPKAREADTEQWLREIDQWKALHPLKYKDSEDVLKPQWVIEMLYRTTGGNAIVTTDVGQHQMWVAQYFQFTRPRSLISSGGLGTMGFGLPAAIGAQVGNPNALVISINGDGGLQMCSQELALCSIHNIPVKVVIINNRVLGMVRQWQDIIYNQRFSHIELGGSPDFVKLAEAYGVKGLRATNKQEAEQVWQAALATKGPVVVEFVVPSDENVYPMIKAGTTLDDMLLGDEE